MMCSSIFSMIENLLVYNLGKMGNQYKTNTSSEYVTRFTQEQVDELNSKDKNY